MNRIWSHNAEKVQEILNNVQKYSYLVMYRGGELEDKAFHFL